MKIWKLSILSLILAINSSVASSKCIDKIAAIVNHDVILQSEVNFLKKLIKFNDNQVNNKLLKNDVLLSRQVLEHLIMDQIIFQINQKIGLQISDSQIYQTINDIAQQNHMTLKQIKKHFTQEGISYFSYLDFIRKEIIASEISHREINRHIVILPKEVDTIMQQIEKQNSNDTKINLSKILISFPKNPNPNQIIEAKNQACFLLKRILNGEDFSKLAIIYSSDNQLLKENQTWWQILELPVIFAKALKTAKKNDIIGPILSDVGFYILKVNDLRHQSKRFLVTEAHVRHILLKTSSVIMDKKAKKILNTIANNIKIGKISFANAAKRFSQDFKSARNGGDLGWISMIEIDNLPLYNTIKSLNKKQISKPIHSSLGWHLIQLLDTRCVDKTDIIKRNQAYHILYDKKFSEEAKNWLKKERKNAYVKVLMNL